MRSEAIKSAFVSLLARLSLRYRSIYLGRKVYSRLHFPKSQRWSCGQVHDSRLELLGCELSAVEESGQLLWAAETEAEQATLPTGLASVAPAEDGTGTVSRFGSGVYAFRARYSC